MEKNKVFNYKLKFSSQKEMKFLRFKRYKLERDILTIAFSIFELEKMIKKGIDVNTLKITIDSETYNKINVDLLKTELNDFIIQILKNDIDILIEHKELSKYKRKKKINFKKVNNICLFSGGVDSFSGILNAKKQFKSVEGVFIAHSDQKRVINITDKMIKNILKPNDIKCKKLYAPSVGKEDYSQVRGFLYVLLASIYANLKDSENILITECGTTMYQPKFSPYDSITMTTHPILLKKAKKVIEILLNRKINLVIPFENMTKAEIMINSPLKNHIKDAHSCITQRLDLQDGTCYGCVIRKVGSLCAGIDDANFFKNPMMNNKSNMDNLISLMRFCYDILVDFKNLPSYSKENIKIYGKEELFTRFALDTFSALYLFKKNNSLATPIQNLFLELLDNIGEERLLGRIHTIRANGVKKPDFLKLV